MTSPAAAARLRQLTFRECERVTTQSIDRCWEELDFRKGPHFCSVANRWTAGSRSNSLTAGYHTKLRVSAPKILRWVGRKDILAVGPVRDRPPRLLAALLWRWRCTQNYVYERLAKRMPAICGYWEPLIILMLPVIEFLVDNDIRYMAKSIQERRALATTFQILMKEQRNPCCWDRRVSWNPKIEFPWIGTDWVNQKSTWLIYNVL
jgi:hypothetical protein